ncbi:MAG: hypothetical protein FJ095_14845 [Deltaproteobacteria bacterium]|nr:hypothetical protein [Deltaproteobacteria bacterium]
MRPSVATEVRRGLVVTAVLASAATGVVALPELALNRGVDVASVCFEAFERAESAPEESCRASARRWLSVAARIPWTARRATLAEEELDARWAVARYVDAAVGRVDDEALAGAWKPIDEAREALLAGTARLRFDDLGRPLPLPNDGRLAFQLGDRRALDEHAFAFVHHDVEKHAIRAVLVEGLPERAIRLAEHYQGRPNTDLRVLVGALDCMSKEPRPNDLVVEVEGGRAAKKTANFARDFGEVRVVLDACSRLRGTPAIPPPTEQTAGSLDRFEQRAALALRRWPDECDPAHVTPSTPRAMEPCRGSERNRARVQAVLERLASPDPLAYRLELVALVAPWFDEASPLTRLARPRPAERSATDRIPWSIDEWLDRHDPAAPFVMPRAYAAAASRLTEMALAGDPDKAVATLAGVMRMHAARGFAFTGDAARASEALEGALVELAPMKGQAQLARSSLAWLLGDLARAVAVLEPTTVGTPRDRAAVRFQRALLLLPDVEASKAELTLARVDAVNDPVLADRCRWFLAALGVFDASVLAPADADALPTIGALAGVSPDVRAGKTSRALGVWRAWLESHEARRRALRYRALEARGHAPHESLVAHLLLGAKLAPAGREERWLDAFFALDAVRLPVTEEVWWRYVVARARGDSLAAERWRKRFDLLANLAFDPARAELWRVAGL